MSRSSILRTLQSRAGEIRKFGVRRIGLFGSYARGGKRPRSDVDILVEFDESSMNFDNYMGLRFLLEELLPRRVDLVIAQNIKPYFREATLKEVISA